METLSPAAGCPACGGTTFYYLSDGRRQCRSCRKKSAPHQRSGRLPDDTRRGIARLFWVMASAEQGAVELGLNRKTVQRYYTLLRQRIHDRRERLLNRFVKGNSPTATGSPPAAGEAAAQKVFAIFEYRGRTWVVFPPKVESFGRFGSPAWVRAESQKALVRLDLDRFHCMKGSGSDRAAPTDPGNEFWIFAKKGLRSYRGGYRKNFPLFVREMEFRFNHRHDPTAVAKIMSMIRNETVEETSL